MRIDKNCMNQFMLYKVETLWFQLDTFYVSIDLYWLTTQMLYVCLLISDDNPMYVMTPLYEISLCLDDTQ